VAAGPNLDGKAGLIGAYNPKYHEIDLRTNLSPLASASLGQILAALGVPGQTICLPIDVTCAPASQAPAAAATPHAAAATARTPISGVLDLLGGSPVQAQGTGHVIAAVPTADHRGASSWLRRTAHRLLGAIG
jgi:hypothetical protein